MFMNCGTNIEKIKVLYKKSDIRKDMLEKIGRFEAELAELL